MPELTRASMHDARDAEDTRRLESGEYAALVESYYGVMLDRSRVRVRTEADAIAVAAEVAIRLLSELERGRRYRARPSARRVDVMRT